MGEKKAAGKRGRDMLAGECKWVSWFFCGKKAGMQAYRGKKEKHAGFGLSWPRLGVGLAAGHGGLD